VRRRLLAGGLGFFLITATRGALAGECDAAMRAASKLVVWKDDEPATFAAWEELLRWQRRVAPRCVDGGVATELTSFVTFKLSRSWSSLDELLALTRRTQSFATFVIGRINSTASRKELERLLASAEDACPVQAQPLCTTIAAAATEAIAWQDWGERKWPEWRERKLRNR
jgi:hypothetical protein